MKLFLFSALLVASAQAMPSPFTRELSVTYFPSTTGQDVLLVQNMLNRNAALRSHYGNAITLDSWYGASETKPWVQRFQYITSGLTSTGVVDAATASALMSCCSADGYLNDEKTAGYYGKLFKIVVPLPSVDRSVEATAWLLDKDNTLLHKFPVRTHGHRSDGTSQAWPDYYDDAGCDQLSSNCNTPTGMSEADLNTPEPAAYSDYYGTADIVRLVRGMHGNQGLLLSDVAAKSLRTSILMHTFDATAAGWAGTGHNMPNSAGCIHAHPDDMATVVQKIKDLGVIANTNPGHPYSYSPTTQGLFSVYLATTNAELTPAHMMSNGVNEESSTEKFFKTTAGIAVGAVAIMFVLGVVGAAAMSKAGYQTEFFRLSAERFSLIVGERFSTVTGRASATEANPVGGETEMANSRASENPVIGTHGVNV